MGQMNFLEKMKKWPIDKKRIFSLSLAIFITVLILIISLKINSIGKFESQGINNIQNNPISSLQESFSQIFNEAKPMLDQVIGSSSQLIEQINSTSSSFSSSSNVVE